MSIWDILGVEATGDTSIIRKAYAKKLRIYHPEEDPEGYQRLREAYDSAMKQAPYFKTEEEETLILEEGITANNAASDSICAEPSPAYAAVTAAQQQESDTAHPDLEYTPPEYTAVNQHKQPIPLDPIHQFISQVDEVYEDFSLRIDSGTWEQLLDQDIAWDVEKSEELQYALLSYLEDHRHLPRPVWQQLDGMFHFSENRDELLDRHSEAFVDYIMRQIHGTTELRYECFKRHLRENIDIEHYLDLREHAQSMLMHNEPEEAGTHLAEAHAMFADDPDLQLMRGQYYLEIGEPEEALNSFSQAIRLLPEDIDGYRYRAQILFDQQKYEAVIQDLDRILEREPQNTDALSLKGRCYIELGEMDQAREILKQSNQLDNTHIHSFIYLCLTANKRNYDRSDIDPAEKKRAWRNNMLFYAMMVLRLSWLYILVYLVLQLFFDLHPLFTGMLVAVLLWNSWKMIRTHRVIAT